MRIDAEVQYYKFCWSFDDRNNLGARRHGKHKESAPHSRIKMINSAHWVIKCQMVLNQLVWNWNVHDKCRTHAEPVGKTLIFEVLFHSITLPPTETVGWEYRETQDWLMKVGPSEWEICSSHKYSWQGLENGALLIWHNGQTASIHFLTSDLGSNTGSPFVTLII